jgi:hypothetical protein
MRRAFDRSHLVLAAAVLFAVLAVGQAFRDNEPASVASKRTEGDAPPPAVSTAPPASEAAHPRSLHVQGHVTNARGDRLPGVHVAVRGSRGEESVTDSTGAYELRLEGNDHEVPELRFTADGYVDGVVELERASLGAESVRVDVRLEPAPGAIVSGTLRNERGSPIAGETVHLHFAPANLRHAAVTGADGRFLIPGVEPRPGYYLFVRPKSGYGDYQKPLSIGEDGLALDIALEALATARLTGRVVDPEGRPIPNLAFSVVSGQALRGSLQAKSDAEGRFVVDDVPTGHLSFLASAPEKLAIGGFRLLPGSDGDVLLRADWGDSKLFGRVVDAGGRPLSGAEVELSWSHVSEGATGRTNRSALTDAKGAFEFRRVAAGIHRLEVRAPGQLEVQLDYDVTPQSPGVEVQLEPMREAG